jgi:hypothetical protein
MNGAKHAGARDTGPLLNGNPARSTSNSEHSFACKAIVANEHAYRQRHELTEYRKPFLLSELRVAALRCRLWAADLDSVGVALKADLITPEQALDLLDPHALAFVDVREEGGAS